MTDKVPMDDRAAVRKRPGMYVGDTEDGSGLLQMCFEVLGNSMDQVLAGKAGCIHVSIIGDQIQITDDGPGISTQPKESEMPWLEQVLTSLHTTASADHHHPHVHLGPWFHGNGLAVVNFLSESFTIETVDQGRRFQMTFSAGIKDGPLVDLGPDAGRGTRVCFTPDFSIFQRSPALIDRLGQRLWELACFNAGLDLVFQGKSLCQSEGYIGMVRQLAEGRQAIESPVHFNGSARDVVVDVAFQWTHNPTPIIRAFVSQAPTPDGGAHVKGFEKALHKALAQAGEDSEIDLKRKLTGLVAVIHISMDDPRFGAPTKGRLESPEAAAAVIEVLTPQFVEYLGNHPGWRANLWRHLAPRE